jgi:hypothetical protein
MRRRVGIFAFLLVILGLTAQAAPVCERPEDSAALRVAALQQEMMVAAFMCHDVAAYNDFVLSHRAALQESDRNLMAFFQRANPQSGFDAYNLYKTELANTSSLRSLRDRYFCYRVKADFQAAKGRSLDQLWEVLPYPVDTGSVRCLTATTAQVSPPPMASATPQVSKPVRRRTWLGRLVDAIFH